MNSKASVVKPEVSEVLEILQEGHREILDHLDKLLMLAAEPPIALPTEESRARARQVIAFFSGPAREHNYDEERHVLLEESLLYPELRDLLKPTELRSIKREMTGRRAGGGARG